MCVWGGGGGVSSDLKRELKIGGGGGVASQR